jgi:hypothetical protein
MGAVVAASARVAIPLIALLALGMLASEPSGDGVGFRAGLALAFVIVIHTLVFGAQAGQRAFAIHVARALLAGGVLAVLVGGGSPHWRLSAHLVEGGLCAATVSGASILLGVLVGRAPTLRDAL